jgi:hypothetical protein
MYGTAVSAMVFQQHSIVGSVGPGLILKQAAHAHGSNDVQLVVCGVVCRVTCGLPCSVYMCLQEACVRVHVMMYVCTALHMCAVILQPEHGYSVSYYCPCSEWLRCCCPACIVCMGPFCAAAVTAAVAVSSGHGVGKTAASMLLR